MINLINKPRDHINKLHCLNNILLIEVISAICGVETWKQMQEFAIFKIEFLKTFIGLPNRVPSDDTFNRVFSSIDTEEFEKLFVNWASSLTQSFNNEVISVDEKIVQDAKSQGEKSPVQIVNECANQNNLVIG